MNLTKLLFYFCDLVRREATPPRIAAGVALGLLMGFTPWLTLQGVMYLTFAFSLRVNVAALAASTALFTLIHWILSPALHLIGFWLLTDVSALSSLWTLAYHSPMLPLTRFNHSTVMGGLAVSWLLALPLYWLSRLTCVVAGEKIVRWGKESVHAFSSGASRLLRNYAQYQRQKEA